MGLRSDAQGVAERGILAEFEEGSVGVPKGGSCKWSGII